jgi:P-type conjugative transfer protein TrbG
MKLPILLLASVSTLCAGACAAQTLVPTPTSAPFKPADLQRDLLPDIPVPHIAVGSTIGPILPLVPVSPLAPIAPTTRVQSANRAAIQEPTRANYLNAVQIYPYSDTALYRLYTAPQQVSDIVLQPGETLTAISAGDTARWTVGDTSSGSAPTKQVHVMVKPFAPGLKTNIVILTDRHTYHLVAQSTEHVSMAAVSWSYPGDGLIAEKGAQGGAPAASAPIDTGLALENLDFRYTITGDSPAWKPVRAFDDGRKVYIEFPGGLDRGEAPPLFVVGEGGRSDLVNYRVRGNYYVVDRLFAAAELRLGNDKQQVVRITRADAAKPSQHSLFGD